MVHFNSFLLLNILFQTQISIWDPLSDEISDYLNADLFYSYDKVDNVSTIIEDNIQPPNEGRESKDEETHFNENMSPSNNTEESIVTSRLTSFPLPKETQRNTSKNKLPGSEEQLEILDKKVEKKNGKSKTLRRFSWI